ncbi:response regulator transcription factor [Streptomyces sp. NPDC089919]|uniref:response regulator transcription factor n=1 Tax=Streptomyces sp. NPDC089919 TaxID=3155188 RepID=UPI00344470EA
MDSGTGAGTGEQRVGSVVVADDEPMVRRGLRVFVEAGGEFRVVAEAADGREAVAAVRAHRPDILLLDVRMPRMNGLEATAELRAAQDPVDTRIVVMTTFGLDEYVEQALALGADGFLLKDTPPDALLDALRAVRDGNAALSPRVLRHVLDTFRSPAAGQGREVRARLDALSPRESEVLALVAEGLSNQEIGVRLHMAETTVKAHVSHMLNKLGAANRVQLAVLAHTAGPPQAGPPR